MNRLWRGCRLRRCYSDVQNPILRPNLFSLKALPQNILDIPKDTFPNPLFSLSKQDIISLKENELEHLLSFPSPSKGDADRFYLHIIEIIHENIIKDTALAARLMRTISDNDMRTTVVDCLQEYYTKDAVRLSIVKFMDDPDSDETSREMLKCLAQLMETSTSLPAETALMMLSYLKKLTSVDVTRTTTFFLALKYLDFLLRNLSSLQQRDLYGCLLHINMRFKDAAQFEKLQQSLLQGSLLDKFVACTGSLDPVWHDANQYEFSNAHREKMVNFFTLLELEFFSKNYIREKDVIFANLFLDLLVTKFERQHTPRKVQVLLDMILQHSMAFKGPQTCLKFLQYMLDANLQITPSTLLKILKRFRAESCTDEALMLVNYLHNEKLTHGQRAVLVSEIMQVIADKFFEHPQIVVGYFASLFDSEKGLQILKDLLLLDVVYGPGTTDHNFNVVQKADVHQDLQISSLTHDILKIIYLAILRNLPRTDALVIGNMFERYLDKIVEARDQNAATSIFHPDNLDEGVVTALLDQLLKVEPYAKGSFELKSDSAQYATAKRIAEQFLEQVHLKRENRGAYMMELLISSALLKHGDIAFAARMIKNARDANISMTFNILYPFIAYHYSRGEHHQALQWYNLLVLNGVKAKSFSAEKLFSIAKELNWPVKGTRYKATGQKRNKRAREEQAKLDSDSLSLRTLDQEFIETDSGTDAQDVNLMEELGSILRTVSFRAKEVTE